MKTLNEEIAAIKSAKLSKAAKKAAIINLGITKYEADILLGQWDADPATTATTRRIFTFGVEIECFVNRRSFMSYAQHSGLEVHDEDYNHRTRPHFKIVNDASVRGIGGSHESSECVTPVLKGNRGKADLKKLCKALNKADAKVNRTCGLHVHIGARHLSDKQYCNVFVNYLMMEDVIDTFMAVSRRDNQYAARLSGRASTIKWARSKEEMARNLSTRYLKVNPRSYERHQTIEFRQHGGTTDYDKIVNWVSFCGKLVNWSMNNRLTAPIATIDEIPFISEEEKAFFKARAIRLA